MDKLNKFDYEQLESLLNKLIEKKVREVINSLGIESSSFGKVVKIDKVNVDADGNVSEVIRASVQLSDDRIIENLYNASEKNLSVGDKVKIYGSQTDLSNRFIGVKYEKEVSL